MWDLARALRDSGTRATRCSPGAASPRTPTVKTPGGLAPAAGAFDGAAPGPVRRGAGSRLRCGMAYGRVPT